MATQYTGFLEATVANFSPYEVHISYVLRATDALKVLH